MDNSAFGVLFYILGLDLLSYFIHFSNAISCGPQTYIGDAALSTTPSVDTNIGMGVLLVDNTAACCGLLTSWEFYGKRSGPINFQVWRDTGTYWSLVGENQHEVTISAWHPAGQRSLSVPEDDRIFVQPGDVLGWYTSDLPVLGYNTYNGGNGQTTGYYTTALGSGTSFDWETQGNSMSKRKYGIRARLDPIDPFTHLDAAKVVYDHEVFNFTIGTNDLCDISLPATVDGFFFNSNSGTLTNSTQMNSGTYYFIFVSTDMCGGTVTWTFNLNVQNSPPVIANLPATVFIREDQESPLRLYDIDVRDATGDDVTCVITSTNPGSTAFSIVQTTVSSIHVKSMPSFSYGTVNLYLVHVSCADKTAAATATLTVYIQSIEAQTSPFRMRYSVVEMNTSLTSPIRTIPDSSLTACAKACAFTTDCFGFGILGNKVCQIAEDVSTTSTSGATVYLLK